MVENACCYVTSNDILITWIHIAVKVSLTRPVMKHGIKKMKMKNFVNHSGLK